MFLDRYLWGILEDNATLFSIKHVHLLEGISYKGYKSSQPLMYALHVLFSRVEHRVFLYNSIVFVSFALALFFSYRLFAKFFSNKLIRLILSLSFTFSPYFFYQTRSHLDLAQVWLVLVCINLMLGKASVLRSIFLGAALAVLTGFSNYLGYFTLIFMFLYVGTKLALVDRHLRKGIIAGYFLAFSVFISLLGVFLLPYVKSIIGEASLGAIGGQSRSLGDFVIFTSRPWYYFLPSVDNPFFGNLSQKAIDWLQNDWGYWLTANYFKSEHSASYLGLVNFLFALLGGIYILRGVTKQKGLWTKEKEISVLGIVGILIFFLTWPPFFTVSLHKIYTPSYLLWKIAPMFRSLARLGILILLIELVFTGTGYLVFVDFIKRKFKTPFAEVFVLLFFVICLVEFYIPIKLNYIGDTPEVFSYIEQNTPNDTALVIYPYEKIEDAVFWLPFYQRYLVNHMNAELTESLPTPEGVLRAKDLGSDYILYFPKADEKNLGEFFEQTPLLQKVAKFSYTGEDVVYYKFMKVQKRGDFASFSSILYKIK